MAENRRLPAHKRRAYQPRIVLDPRAVKEFAERKLDDWRWLKEVPKEELQKAMREVVPNFRFATDPRTHQLACTFLGTKMPRFLFSLEMGTGKTKIILDLIRYRKHRGELRSALVCVPNLINLSSWEDQLRLHAPDLSYQILEGSKAERMDLLEESCDVRIINYGGLPVYMAGARRRTKKGTEKRVMVVEDAQDFSDRFNFLALDECHVGLSTVRSLQYRLTQVLSWRADYCYGTTGTPMGGDPEKLWPQLHVIDQGETLGTSLAMFHAAYFHEKEDYWAGIKHTFNNRLRPKLHLTLQHRSLRYSDKEFTDLPTLTPSVKVMVEMSRAQLKHNAALLTQARELREAGENPGNVFIRQRQTTAGFIAVRGEDVQKLEVAFSPNPKADALEQLLTQMDEGEKVTIYHSYIYSGHIIQERLKALGIRYAGVGHGFADPTLQRKRFLMDPKCRVFVLNCQAGATGLDGLQQVCRYGIFYESPVSPSLRKQAVKRLHRDGQKRPVHFYDLVARGIQVDNRVLSSIEAGIDLFAAIVEGKEKVL